MNKNLFDRIEVDIEALHERLAQDPSLRGDLKFYLGWKHRWMRRRGLWVKCVDSGFARGWFEEFAEFWRSALQGRPLKLHDFFYLHSHYRAQFQSMEITGEQERGDFMEAWRRPENIFLIFSAAYRYALEPFAYDDFLPYLPSRGRVLEYGCGLAPVVTSMIRSRARGYEYAVADIRSFTFAYAKYLLLRRGVTCVDIDPRRLPELPGPFNAIFLMTVLEHLPNPLEVTRLLTESLAPGGRLFFDYIKSDGRGLDTQAGAAQRGAVLEYIRANYDVIHGALNENESMSRTVAQKKMRDRAK